MDIPLNRYVGATLFIFFTTGFLWYWTAFPLINTIYIHGYPRNFEHFQSSRYLWDWWFVWVQGLNWFLPLLMAMSMTNRSLDPIAKVHRFFATMGMVSNAIVFIALTILWVGFCNTGYSAIYSACNDYHWCEYYANTVWCPNGAATFTDSLYRNSEATQTWAFSLVFGVFSIWYYTINDDLKGYGIFYSEK